MSHDVIFISLPANGIDLSTKQNETFVQRIFPPLGIISLACHLKTHAPDVHISHIDLNAQNPSHLADSRHIAELIAQKMTGNSVVFCIGIMMSASYSSLPIVLEGIQIVSPGAVIVCGGFHATASGHRLLNDHPEIGFVVCGEGEEAFSELYAAIVEGRQPDIPGVHSRDNMRFASSELLEPCALIEDINVSFRMYADFPDIGDYCRQTTNFSLSKGDIGERSFAIMASRGCPVQCSFCAARLVHGRRPRWRSLDNIRGEMLWLYEHHGVTKFYVMDVNFVPKDKSLALFRMFSELPIPGLEIVIQNMSVNHTDFEIIDALIGVGINYLPLAIESGVVETQKRIGKNCNLEKAKSLVAYAQSKGMQVRCFFILGFPGETIEEMEQTIDFAREMNADWSSFNVALPFPGTRMYSEFVSLGCIEDTPDTWKTTNIRERSFDTQEIGAQDITMMAYRANLDINFINSRLIRNGLYKEAENVFKNFVTEMDFHLFAFDCLRRICFLTGRKDEEREISEHMVHLFCNDSRAKEFKKYFDLLEPGIRALLEKACANVVEDE